MICLLSFIHRTCAHFLFLPYQFRYTHDNCRRSSAIGRCRWNWSPCMYPYSHEYDSLRRSRVYLYIFVFYMVYIYVSWRECRANQQIKQMQISTRIWMLLVFNYIVSPVKKKSSILFEEGFERLGKVLSRHAIVVRILAILNIVYM